MPKFRNVSNDERDIAVGGVWQRVAPGDVLDVPKEEVDGFLGQDAVWEPLSTQVKHAAKEKHAEEAK